MRSSAPTETTEAGSARNIFAVTAASFIGFTGFTLVMPFLPLYINQLGVTDVGEIALWTGFSLGVTPALTAILSPVWGRVADRFGRKLMVERSLLSFVFVMGAMAYVTRAWHVFALRAVQGVFAGYGALALTMAAESVPRDRMASAIGTVQTAQRLGPALGPVIGGLVAQLVGLRRAFLVTASFYAVAFLLVLVLYRERPPAPRASDDREGRVTFRNILAFENFLLLMLVIFGVQFVDRSFGPILPLYVAQIGVSPRRVPLVSGVLFSVLACVAAAGNTACGRLLARYAARRIIASGTFVAAGGLALLLLSREIWVLVLAHALLGAGVGTAMTAAYTAAGSVIPSGAHGTGFGFLTSASLAGLALSPVVSGFVGATSIRIVFVLDIALLGLLALLVRHVMVDRTLTTEAPAVEDA